MIVLLLGPPGAGKGTQGERLAAALHLPKLATGDVLRTAVNAGTELGLQAKRYMDRGDLVPDDVILGIVKEALSAPESGNGVILDGVVRTIPQAEGLARSLADLGRSLDAILFFDVPTDELVERLSGRLVCQDCQTVYASGQAGASCAKCGGRLVRRADDDPLAVRRRLQVYQQQSAPVMDWYSRNGVPVRRVDAVGPVDAITKRALEALKGDSTKK